MRIGEQTTQIKGRMENGDLGVVIRPLKLDDVASVRRLCREVQSESAWNEFSIHLHRFLTSVHVVVTPFFFFFLHHFILKINASSSFKSCIQQAIICEGVRFFFFWRKIKHVFSEGEDLKDILKFYDNPNRCFLVAEADGKIIGTVAVRETDEANVAKLFRMFVHPSFRRKGVASKLIAACHNGCRKLKYQSISLRTHITNKKALACYEKAGYAIVERRNFASIYPHSFDTVHYVIELSDFVVES